MHQAEYTFCTFKINEKIMRSIWSGVISFGLVNIPVNLYSASQEVTFDFDFLHKKDLARIRYARMCKAEEKEVPFQDIVRGIEVKNGKYVVVQDKDFTSAYPRATRTIEIEDFVDQASIDPVYFDKPYYLEPSKPAAKAYHLLRRALEKTKKVGVARYVLRHKEYLGMIKPVGGILILNQLRYAHEVRDAKELQIPKAEVATKREMAIATSLIEKLATNFNPLAYQDRYARKMQAVINEKAKGQKAIKPKESPIKPTAVTDLMATLKASLEHHPSRSKRAA